MDWVAPVETRNLHGLAAPAAPGLRVLVDISEMRLTLTDEHIQMLLVAASSLSSAPKTSKSSAPAIEPNDEPATASKLAPQAAAAPVPAASEPIVVVGAISAHLRHFSVELGKAAPHPHNRLARKVVPLISLSIDRLSAAVSQSSNGSMSVCASIRSVALRDIKPRSKSVFKQLFGPAGDSHSVSLSSSGIYSSGSLSTSSDWDRESSGTSPSDGSSSRGLKSDSTSPFIFATVNIDAASSKTSARVRLSNPRIVAVPTVVFDLLSFVRLATTLPSSDSATEAPAPAPRTPRPPFPAQEKAPEGPKGILELNAEVSGLEVCILRDSANAKTQAIVLKTSVFVGLKSPGLGSSLFVQAFIRQFQVYKCFMHRVESSALSLLDPFDSSVRFEAKMDEPQDSIEVGLDRITVKFSHQDILLGVVVGKSFVPPVVEVERPSQPPRTTVDEEELLPNSIPIDAEAGRKLSVSAAAAGVQVILIDDLQGRNVPLVSGGLSEIEATVSRLAYPASLKVKVELVVGANYYNLEGANWEPVVESWPVGALIVQKRDPVPSLGISLLSQQILNANVTSSLIATITRLTRSLQDELENLSALEAPAAVSSARSSLHPFVLKNNSGLHLKYWTDKISQPLDLAHESWAPLIFHSSRDMRKMRIDPDGPRNSEGAGKGRGRLAGAQARLGVHLDGAWLPLKDVPVGRAGSRLIELVSDPLRPRDSSSAKRFVVIDVDTVNSSVVVNVRSSVSIRNMCTSRAIRVGPSRLATVDHRKIMPGDTFHVPFDWLAALEAGELYLDGKPINADDGSSFSPYYGVKESHVHRIWSSSTPSVAAGKQTDGEAKSVSFVAGAAKRANSHGSIITLNILPAWRLENRVAETMEFFVLDKETGQVVAEQTIASGEDFELFHEHCKNDLLLKVRLNGFQWSSFVKIKSVRQSEKNHGAKSRRAAPAAEFDRVLRLKDDVGRTLLLDVDFGFTRPSTKAGSLLFNEVVSRSVSIFAQYWIMNKSGLPLLFRASPDESSYLSGELAAGQTAASEISARLKNQDPSVWYRDQELACQSEKPLLFSPSSLDVVALVGSPLLQVCSPLTSWSTPINIGTAGHSGNVCLSDGAINFQLGVHIDLGVPAKFFRTKVVTFTPQCTFPLTLVISGILIDSLDVLVNASANTIFYKQKLNTPMVISASPIPMTRESSDDDLAAMETRALGHLGLQDRSLSPSERRPFHWAGRTLIFMGLMCLFSRFFRRYFISPSHYDLQEGRD